MPQIRLADGGQLNTDTLPEDEAELERFVYGISPVFEPLEGWDAEANPEDFIEELGKFAKKALRISRIPEIEFRESGMLAEVAYWVFSTESDGDGLMYLLAIRNGATMELSMADGAVWLVDSESQELKSHPISPAQAALLEFISTDSHPQSG